MSCTQLYKSIGIGALTSIMIMKNRWPNIRYEVLINVLKMVVISKTIYGAEIWGVERGRVPAEE